MARRAKRALIAPAVVAAGLMGLAPVLAAPAAEAAPLAVYGPTTTVTVTVNVGTAGAGSTITVTIHTTHPGESFTFTLTFTSSTTASVHGASVGTPTVVLDAATVLGTATADASGNVSTSLTLPSNLTPGTYTLTATGNEGDVGSTTIVVTSPTTAPAAAAPTTPSSSGSGLAFTGTDAIATTAVGAGAIAAGGVLVLGSRRRRQHAWR